jgi:50S ribosomal protein L16 3-hydroxylase
MALQTLLGSRSRQSFADEYLHRLPLALPQTAKEFCPLGTWETLQSILRHPADIMVVKQGKRYEGQDPQDLHELRALSADGYTILVRHAERHHEQLSQLAKSFQRDFCAPVDIHVYVTPAGTHGFSWHYDAEDVFIIQTAGTKTYSLRKNTVNPWPLVETTPDNMRFERELMPLMQVELHSGDWLYIPCGYWHKADAAGGEEAAISLAVGVMSPAAIDLLDFLRPRLLSSLLWRQRLPTAGEASSLTAEEWDARIREVSSMLADDLSSVLRDQYLAQRYRERLRHVGHGK